MSGASRSTQFPFSVIHRAEMEGWFLLQKYPTETLKQAHGNPSRFQGTRTYIYYVPWYNTASDRSSIGLWLQSTQRGKWKVWFHRYRKTETKVPCSVSQIAVCVCVCRTLGDHVRTRDCGFN